jgi:N-acetylglucosaminyldiphosphoundecaprenol N-acetyl-beta-D-mannosaminyltransferase
MHVEVGSDAITAYAASPVASTEPDRDRRGSPVGGQAMGVQCRPVRSLSGDRANVLGCEIDRVDLDEAVVRCQAAIESRGFVQHMAINVAKLVAMKSDPQLREGVAQCELVTADGQPIVWASRLLRDPLPERVAGIDLMERLLALADEMGYRVYVLGAQREILERAVDRMRAEFPQLQLAGYRDGYYKEADEPEVARAITAACPDILLVAMSSPRKEFFLARYRERLGVPFVMGVGGAIDVYAGLRQRAPVWLQTIGLEWLFRLVQEPRRLARRYLTTNALFLGLLVRELLLDVRERIARVGPSSSSPP